MSVWISFAGVVLILMLIVIVVLKRQKATVLMTKEVRERRHRIAMGTSIVLVAVLFLVSVSYKQKAGAVGRMKQDLENMESQNWDMGVNEGYVNQILKAYNVAIKYNNNLPSASKFEKELWAVAEKSLSGYDQEMMEFSIEFFGNEKEGKEGIEDDCFFGMYDKKSSEFSYEQKGNGIYCYCKKHGTLSQIFPYHMYEQKWVKELEDQGLEGLADWMKRMEERGIEVTTKDQKKVRIMESGGEKIFQGIQVVYDSGGIYFRVNRKQLKNYRYLDEVQTVVENRGWMVENLMSQGYYKGISCYLYKDDKTAYDDGSDGKGIRVILTMDETGILQLDFFIERAGILYGDPLFEEGEREPVQQLFVLFGMEEAQASRLAGQLSCIKNDEKGSRDGYQWKISRGTVYTDESGKNINYKLTLYKK